MNHLRHKLRQYRFAFWCVAIAETLCWGVIIQWLALLWLGWRIWRAPTDRQIATLIESQHPALKGKLTAALELDRSADGSPALRNAYLAEVDTAVASVDVAPLLSLRPVLVLIIVAIAVNVTFSLSRHHDEHTIAPVVSSRPITPPATMTIPELTAALRAQSTETLRQLPPHARSLDGLAVATKEDAAEALAEFARLAEPIPELRDLAGQARALAAQFAGASTESTAAPPAPNTPVSPPTGELPAAIVAGESWQAPIVATSADRLAAPSQYQPQINAYFETLATLSR